MKAFLFFLLFSKIVTAQEKSENLIVWESLKVNEYALFLINTSLELTSKNENKVKISLSEKLNQESAVKEAIKGESLHLIIGAVDNRRLKDLIPIKFPIVRGIGGMRVCFIRAKEQEVFSQVQTLNDFKNLGMSFVVGRDWPDRKIFEYNGIRVHTDERDENLFSLTANVPRSCFSRSVDEFYDELSYASSFSLKAEKELLIYYEMPHFIFISKNKAKLAKRIEKGLNLYSKQMEYFEKFWKKFFITFEKFNLINRRVIKLKVPNTYIDEYIKSNPKMWLPKRLGL